MIVTRIGDGAYRVEQDDRTDTVYVAGSRDEVWAFAGGRVYVVSDHAGARNEESCRASDTVRVDAETTETVRLKADTTTETVRLKADTTYAAPMPGTVLKVLVARGARVRAGDPLVILEAMKMELPVLAADGGIVAAVHCREGELVAADAPLVDIGAAPA
jgi:3-methylcrotonyl-CoA carboxylase alpha subunit